MLQVSLYRYNPETDQEPWMQDVEVDTGGKDMMVLDVLELIKHQDPTTAFRRSCREGVCGSDGLNINGKNGLACITPLSATVKNNKLVVRPLPGLPVVRDLVVDMTMFYTQYEKVQPYLQNDTPAPGIERLQSPEEREKLDGLYECILCACCSTSCPSFWWNPDRFIGPAGLLQSYRFLADSRDTATEERLSNLDDPFSVFRCHGIQNCVNVCPKGLNPTRAIGHIRNMLLKMVDQLTYDLRSSEKLVSCITIKIRYADFNTYTKQKHISYTANETVLSRKACELFDILNERRQLIRLIGVKFSSLVQGNQQLNMFEDTPQSVNLYKEELLELANIESIKQEHIQSIPAFLRKRLIKHGIIQHPNGQRPRGIPLIIIINRDTIQKWVNKPCNVDLHQVQ